MSHLAPALQTISVICFMSLNPPLPPYIMSPPSYKQSWEWADLYPPIRFAQLCHAVKEMPLLKNGANHSEISSYIEELLSISKIPTIYKNDYPTFEFQTDTPNFEDENSTYPQTLQASYHNYVFWAQSKLNDLRQSALPFFTNFGTALSSGISIEHMDLLMASDTNKIPFARCPLHWTNSDEIGFSCPSDFGNWLILSRGTHYALFDLIVGDGNYDFSAFPMDIRNSDFPKIVKQSIERSLKQDL